MNNMKKVTYIVPIHVFDEDIKPYLEKSLTSLSQLKGAEKAEIFLVGELDIIIKAQTLFNEVAGGENAQTVTLVPTDEKDLFTKINLAVSKCKTPYFCILELDDAFYPYWNEVAQRYTDKDYSIILPMAEIVTPKDEVAGLANELVWDVAFIDKGTIGFVEHGDLLVFKDFLTSGGYIKTSDFKELGKLKSEYKIAAWYEYLLRTVTSGKQIFVAPRIGYKHTVLREGSYMSLMANELSREDGMKLIQEVIEKYPFKEPSYTAGDE